MRAFVFFFNDTATTEIYTLSLHDALPMLFLSQADRGQGARLAPWASLAALAHEVIDFHEAALQEADLQVVVQGDAAAEVDARLLRRALSNLLGNATRDRKSVV